MKPENVLDVLKPQASHTQGPLQVSDGALLCKDVNAYGNFIVADCVRERTPEDNANLQRLAHCWNLHEELLIALENLLRPIQKGWNVSDMQDRIDEAETAIQKAKGNL